MTMQLSGSIVNITFFGQAARTATVAATEPAAQRAARARVGLAARIAARDAKVLARAAKQAAKRGEARGLARRPMPAADAKLTAARLRDLARALEAGAAGKLDDELQAGLAVAAGALEGGASPREVAAALRAALRPEVAVTVPAARAEARVLVRVVPVPCIWAFAGEPA